MKFKEKVKYSIQYTMLGGIYYLSLGCYILLGIWAIFILGDWIAIFEKKPDVNVFLTIIYTTICIFIFSFIFMITKWSDKEKNDTEDKLLGRKSWEEHLAEQELLERKKEQESIKEEKRIESEKILSKDEIRKYTKYGPKNPLLELDKMIGMDSVKEQINRLISQFLFEKERKNAGIVSRVNTCNHMCFLGPAGTGKTTVRES